LRIESGHGGVAIEAQRRHMADGELARDGSRDVGQLARRRFVLRRQA
jgi:hypothetical protein